MSRIALQGNASGTGTLTIAAPSTNTDYTLNLPEQSGTILTSASNANFPTGSVLQVVMATTWTRVTTTSDSVWTDTGLTATITPTSSSSKILILCNQHYGNYTSGLGEDFKVLRGSASVKQFTNYNKQPTMANGPFNGMLSFSVLDNPSTASSITYKTQFKHRAGNTGVFICQDPNGGSSGFLPESQLILMEIAG
jgi:hypothetical protein